jgi:hypothetical protein
MHKWLAVAVVVALSGCGSGSPTQVPPPVPTTTLAAVPSPTPTPQPSPTAGTQTCDLAPGPVVRFAIAPREQRTDGEQTDIRVRVVTPYDEEVWCLDRAKTHRIDFNANQRNAAGRECCYQGKVEWKIDDPRGLVVAQSQRDEDGFVYRFNVDPRGLSTSFTVEAELDGLKSYPWQSGALYQREALRIVTMSQSEIAKDCKCIFRGNAIYEGAGCPK